MKNLLRMILLVAFLATNTLAQYAPIDSAVVASSTLAEKVFEYSVVGFDNKELQAAFLSLNPDQKATITLSKSQATLFGLCNKMTLTPVQGGPKRAYCETTKTSNQCSAETMKIELTISMALKDFMVGIYYSKKQDAERIFEKLTKLDARDSQIARDYDIFLVKNITPSSEMSVDQNIF